MIFHDLMSEKLIFHDSCNFKELQIRIEVFSKKFIMCYIIFIRYLGLSIFDLPKNYQASSGSNQQFERPEISVECRDLQLQKQPRFVNN